MAKAARRKPLENVHVSRTWQNMAAPHQPDIEALLGAAFMGTLADKTNELEDRALGRANVLDVQKGATIDLQKESDALADWIFTIREMSARIHADKRAFLTKLGKGRPVNRKSHTDVIKAGQSVTKALEANAALALEVAMTPARIADLKAMVETVRIANDIQEGAKTDRKSFTQTVHALNAEVTLMLDKLLAAITMAQKGDRKLLQRFLDVLKTRRLKKDPEPEA